MSKDETTPAEAGNKPEETVETQETPETETQEESKEETLGELTQKEEKPTVGLDKFLDLKKENKALKNDLEDLKKKIEEGSSNKEVSADIRSLAEEHNVDAEFLEKLATAIRSDAEKSVEERLRPLTEREAKQKREALFNEHLEKTLKEMPEYKDIINPDILKQLAFNPANANKTFRQLVEDTYGNFVEGKKSIETTTPHGGAKSTGLDYEKANRDPSYFKEVMADPELKKKYNEEMLKRVF